MRIHSGLHSCDIRQRVAFRPLARHSLLEAALMVDESAPLYRQALADSMHRYREAGPRVAVDESLQKRWPGYQEHLEHVLPGAFEQAVADAATSFAVDVPATLDSRFGEAEARQIRQPVLVVLGEKSVALHPRFAEAHRLLLGWLPNAEGLILPRATHFLQMENPHDMAEALTNFYTRHAIR